MFNKINNNKIYHRKKYKLLSNLQEKVLKEVNNKKKQVKNNKKIYKEKIL